MGEMRKELFTEKAAAGSRIYFFDAKEAVDGTKYLSISESRSVDDKFNHNRVMVFEEHVLSFNVGLQKAIQAIFENKE
jgi:hypothetical protein